MGNGNLLVDKRLFWGVVHYRCIYCGIWTPRNDKDHACEVCHKSLELGPMTAEYSRYYNPGVENDVKAELRGEVPLKDVYEGCTDEQIKALESGDVELLLKTG